MDFLSWSLVRHVCFMCWSHMYGVTVLRPWLFPWIRHPMFKKLISPWPSMNFCEFCFIWTSKKFSSFCLETAALMLRAYSKSVIIYFFHNCSYLIYESWTVVKYWLTDKYAVNWDVQRTLRKNLIETIPFHCSPKHVIARPTQPSRIPSTQLNSPNRVRFYVLRALSK